MLTGISTVLGISSDKPIATVASTQQQFSADSSNCTSRTTIEAQMIQEQQVPHLRIVNNEQERKKNHDELTRRAGRISIPSSKSNKSSKGYHNLQRAHTTSIEYNNNSNNNCRR